MAFAVVGLSGCADSIFDAPEAEGGSYDDGTQLVLTVAMPQATRAGDDSGRVDATEQECKINSLRLIAFAPGVVENSFEQSWNITGFSATGKTVP